MIWLKVIPYRQTNNLHFRIKDDAKFHDNSAVTAQDIIFTVGKIKDSTIKALFKLFVKESFGLKKGQIILA